SVTACRHPATGAQDGPPGASWLGGPFRERRTQMMEATASATPRPRFWILLVSSVLALSGCAHAAAPGDWRGVIPRRDLGRVRRWRTEWVAALAKAREDGNGAAIATEGPLLDPDAALDAPLPPVGDYRCRVISLGTGRGARGGYTAEPVGQCRINTVGH